MLVATTSSASIGESSAEEAGPQFVVGVTLGDVATVRKGLVPPKAVNSPAQVVEVELDATLLEPRPRTMPAAVGPRRSLFVDHRQTSRRRACSRQRSTN